MKSRQIRELVTDELEWGQLRLRDPLTGLVKLTMLTEFVIDELDLCGDPDNCNGECDGCLGASERVFEVVERLKK